MFDLIIKNGRVNTGAGNPWFKADVGVKEEKIIEIGKIDEEAEEVLDAKGMIVCPGFIDLHDHSDFTILVNREADSKVHMGVSTTVYASCGSGAAPLNDEMRDEIRRQTPYLAEAGVEVDWSTMDEYLELVESEGMSINVAPLVGFGTVRKYVMGMEMREPTGEEMESMKLELVKAMKAGCRGFTTGLRYDPQSYAETEEVIELSKVIAEHGGFYTSHIRDEGDRGDPVGAIREIIRIGKEANLPVNVSHFKVLSKRFWDVCPRLIEMIEDARQEGVQITADQYPYRASGTGLGAWIPKWANEGGNEELVKRLKDPDTYEKIKEGLGESMEDRGGPEAALISSYALDPNLVGMNIAEVAEKREQDPLETAMQLLKEYLEAIVGGEIKGGFSIVNFNQKEENVDMIMQQPWVAFGTDGRVHSPEGILNKHIPAPHPRFYGTFPRVLGKYTRERKILNLNEAIRKMTSLPAQVLGLTDRGLLHPGNYADIVVFDPDTVIDKADFVPKEATKLYPKGIPHLVVNGVVTMRDGEHTGVKAGKILRK
ncbi:amidohydrolase family protein [Candidatus Bathyarchaeota archaeon]|nr:amidohydrolase family protein [Candidatus Bathyarchaeota archaeon]